MTTMKAGCTASVDAAHDTPGARRGLLQVVRREAVLTIRPVSSHGAQSRQARALDQAEKAFIEGPAQLPEGIGASAPTPGATVIK